MSFEFQDLIMADVIKEFYGGNSFSKQEYTQSGIPVLTKGDVKPFGRVRFNGSKFIDVEDQISQGYRITKKGDCILTTRDLTQAADFLGLLSPIPEPYYFLVNQGANILRFTEQVDLDYLVYWTHSSRYRSYIKNHAVGSTQIHLRKEDFLSAPLALPSLKIQKKIAHILRTFDDKIELNHKINETLEGIAKALFKSWFIDFDPVRAKLEGRSTGLSDEISDLFPASFDHSEMGEIPSGWKVCSASDRYQISIGKTPPRKESRWFTKNHDDNPWLSIKDMGKASVFALNTSEFLTKDAVRKFNIKIVPAGTVVVSFKLTVGRVVITPTTMLTNEAIAHFIPSSKPIPSSFSFCLFSDYDYTTLGSTSSIATALNSKMLREMRILDPSHDLKRSFDSIVNPLFRKIQQVLIEVQILQKLRDRMLSKLISCEIRGSDLGQIEKAIGI